MMRGWRAALCVVMGLAVWAAPAGPATLALLLDEETSAGNVLSAAYPPARVDVERATLSVLGARCQDLLGTAIAMHDLDADASRDLVLGEPGAGARGKTPGAGGVVILLSPLVANGRVAFERSSCAPSGESGEAPGWRDLALMASTRRILGVDPGDRTGAALALGDLTGEGTADIAVAAPGGDGPRNDRKNAGEVHVVVSPAALSGDRDLRRAPADLVVHGAAPSDALGDALVIADLSGDGIADLAIGAPGSSGGGRERGGAVFVLFGRATLPATWDLATTPPDVLIRAPAKGQRLGAALAAADMDGDGVAELLVGAPGATGGPNGRGGAGAVYVIDVRSGGRVIDLAVTASAARLRGAAHGDALGASVAACDADGDGVADLLAGATGTDGPLGGRSDAGSVQILAGPIARPSDRDLSVAPASRVVHGSAPRERLGSALAVADADGDGRCDVAAAGDPDTGGMVHLVFGPSALTGALDLAAAYGPYRTIAAASGSTRFGTALWMEEATVPGAPVMWLGAAHAAGPWGTRSDAGEARAFSLTTLLRNDG